MVKFLNKRNQTELELKPWDIIDGVTRLKIFKRLIAYACSKRVNYLGTTRRNHFKATNSFEKIRSNRYPIRMHIK